MPPQNNFKQLLNFFCAHHLNAFHQISQYLRPELNALERDEHIFESSLDSCGPIFFEGHKYFHRSS